MSLQRKIERNQLKKQWKDHNKGVTKRYRSEFRGFWNKQKIHKKQNVKENIVKLSKKISKQKLKIKLEK